MIQIDRKMIKYVFMALDCYSLILLSIYMLSLDEVQGRKKKIKSRQNDNQTIMQLNEASFKCKLTSQNQSSQPSNHKKYPKSPFPTKAYRPYCDPIITQKFEPTKATVAEGLQIKKTKHKKGKSMDIEYTLLPVCDPVENVQHKKGKERVIIDQLYLRKMRERNSISQGRDYPRIVLTKAKQEKGSEEVKKIKNKVKQKKTTDKQLHKQTSKEKSKLQNSTTVFTSRHSKHLISINSANLIKNQCKSLDLVSHIPRCKSSRQQNLSKKKSIASTFQAKIKSNLPFPSKMNSLYSNTTSLFCSKAQFQSFTQSTVYRIPTEEPEEADQIRKFQSQAWQHPVAQNVQADKLELKEDADEQISTFDIINGYLNVFKNDKESHLKSSNEHSLINELMISSASVPKTELQKKSSLVEDDILQREEVQLKGENQTLNDVIKIASLTNISDSQKRHLVLQKIKQIMSHQMNITENHRQALQSVPVVLEEQKRSEILQIDNKIYDIKIQEKLLQSIPQHVEGHSESSNSEQFLSKLEQIKQKFDRQHDLSQENLFQHSQSSSISSQLPQESLDGKLKNHIFLDSAERISYDYYEDDSPNVEVNPKQKVLCQMSQEISEEANYDFGFTTASFETPSPLKSDKKQISLSGISLDDKQQIYEYIFIDLCIEIQDELLRESKILKALRELLNRQKELAKRPKGFKTNSLKIRQYLKQLMLFIKGDGSSVKKMYAQLQKPMGPTTLQILFYMHPKENQDYQYGPENANILDEEIFERFDKKYVQAIKLDRYYEEDSKQMKRVSFLKNAMHIHNKAVFDAFNENLDKRRPYGTWGEPFKWKKVPKFYRQYNSTQKSIYLFQAATQTIQNSQLCCGFIVDKQQCSFRTNSIPEDFIQNIQNQRLFKLLGEYMEDVEEKLGFTDDEEAQILVMIADDIEEELMKEMASFFK